MHSRALSGEPLLYKGNDSAQTDIKQHEAYNGEPFVATRKRP
jgi:hypothetical protein